MSGFRSSHFPARHALASCGCHTAYRRDVLSLSLPGKVSQLPPQPGVELPLIKNTPLPPNRLTDASHSSLTGLRQNLQEFFGLPAVDIGRPRFKPSCLVVLRVPHGRPTPKGQVAEHVHDSETEIMEGPDRRRAKGRCISEIRKRIGRRSIIMKWWQFPRETGRQIFV
jgi:hypothetical protein